MILGLVTDVSRKLAARRWLHTSSAIHRDLHAKYRPQLAFDTISTTPAASSFQDVPPPSTANGPAQRKSIPIPAMDPPPIAPAPPQEKEIIVQGIVIPAKPKPPAEDECCMSGCVHCVYNMYADDLELYTESLSLAHAALVKAGTPRQDWPEGVKRLDEKKGGKEGVKREEKGKMEEGMDPVLLAFLEMEKKLKKKQVSSKGSTASSPT